MYTILISHLPILLYIYRLITVNRNLISRIYVIIKAMQL